MFCCVYHFKKKSLLWNNNLLLYFHLGSIGGRRRRRSLLFLLVNPRLLFRRTAFILLLINDEKEDPKKKKYLEGLHLPQLNAIMDKFHFSQPEVLLRQHRETYPTYSGYIITTSNSKFWGHQQPNKTEFEINLKEFQKSIGYKNSLKNPEVVGWVFNAMLGTFPDADKEEPPVVKNEIYPWLHSIEANVTLPNIFFSSDLLSHR